MGIDGISISNRPSFQEVRGVLKDASPSLPPLIEITSNPMDSIHFGADKFQGKPLSQKTKLGSGFRKKMNRFIGKLTLGLASGIVFVLPEKRRAQIESKLLYSKGQDQYVHLPEKYKINEVNLKSKSGTELYGLYFPAKERKPTLVFSNGNSGNILAGIGLATIGEESSKNSWLDKGFGLFVYDYPGYGKSQGESSEKSLYESLEAVSDYLEEKGVPVSEQVAIGCSLGGAVTVHVASKRRFKAVILASTFKSLPDIVKELRENLKIPQWWFPVSKKITQRFDSIDKAEKIQSPTLILHGENDRLCPLSHGQALEQELTCQKKLIVYSAGEHNGIFSKTSFSEDVSDFILKL